MNNEYKEFFDLYESKENDKLTEGAIGNAINNVKMGLAQRSANKINAKTIKLAKTVNANVNKIASQIQNNISNIIAKQIQTSGVSQLSQDATNNFNTYMAGLKNDLALAYAYKTKQADVFINAYANVLTDDKAKKDLMAKAKKYNLGATAQAQNNNEELQKQINQTQEADATQGTEEAPPAEGQK